MDIYKAFKLGEVIWFHSSRPINWVEIKRAWGESLVQVTTLDNSYFGKLTGFVKRGLKKTFRGWVQIRFLSKLEHVMRHTDRRLWLTHIAKHEYGKSSSIFSDLTTSELWSLWKISRAVTSESVHKSNMQRIKRALLAKGCKFNPDSRLSVRIPPGVKASKRDVRVALKHKLRKSFVPLEICNDLLKLVTVVKGRASTLATVFDSHSKLIKAMGVHDLP